MLCIVANVLHVVHYQIIRMYHIFFAFVDCTHRGSAAASYKDCTQENIIAVVLVDDQQWPPLDMVTVD